MALAAGLGLTGLTGLAGCAATGEKALNPQAYRDEQFSTSAPFSRSLPGSAADACEGARQALMSQGYIVTGRDTLTVNGRKFFQPERGVGTELAISVTCVADKAGPTATVFTTAWQDHFVVKKAASSASLGVSTLGSISLPLNATDDALVKVGVETIRDPAFYQRFYALLGAVLAR